MTRSRTWSTRRAAAAALTLAVAACGHAQGFIWVNDVPKGMNAADATYRIGPGDLIGIRVWNQEAHSVERTRVREDGKISIPMLNDVDVGGSEPAELARRLEMKLKSFITNPIVTVIVLELRPVRVSVLGKVARPGVYDVDRGSGVIHALAAAGGLTPFADGDRVFLLRSGYWADLGAAPARIRFRYEDLRTGNGTAPLFVLRAGDVIVVE